MTSAGTKRAFAEEADGERPVRSRLAQLIRELHHVDVEDGNDGPIQGGEWCLPDWLHDATPEHTFDPKLVRDAKLDELNRFRTMNVYKVVKREVMENDAEGKCWTGDG